MSLYYRCYFVDRDDRIYDFIGFYSEGDVGAIAHARHVFPTNTGNGFELWQERRLVERQTRRADRFCGKPRSAR
ncbi:MAG: hypothetical protein ACREFL_06480 [Stellaceae bacterium]